jgi:AAA+ superfamily predicted ATPase
MEPVSDLRLLLASRYPLVVAQAHDEPRLLDVVRRAAAQLQLPVWTWSVTSGLARDGQPSQYGTADATAALQTLEALQQPGVFVFRDFCTFLQNPVVTRRVKELAQAARPGQTVVLTGPRPQIPAELAELALRWTLPPLDHEGLAGVVQRTLENLAMQGVRVTGDPKVVEGVVAALRGLPAADAERLIRQAALRDGAVDEADVAYLHRARAEQLAGDGVVELVDTSDVDLEHVGGMKHLKEWVALRGKALDSDAARFGLEAPRGVLLTGVPGCGKSLLAKALAKAWELPLVLLDPARLYGPYVGQSEERLRDALMSAEAMSPVVLWIDEIEKGFAAGGAGDDGVSQRILGTFLRWLQERPGGVFVVATCNEVEQLPPELLRKGRFDAVFFVDLPDEPQRREILTAHLSKRHRDPAEFDLALLAAASKGFSGAELEAAVVGALYRAYAADAELTTGAILTELESTVPLSRSRAEDIQRLRAWAGERAIAA